MLAPIDPSVLERNPRFRALVKDLTSARLNPDGTSRDVALQRRRTEVRKRLQSARTEAAKTQVLRHALGNCAARASELPPELQEVAQIVSAQLDGRVALEDREFLEDDVEYFLEHVDEICQSVSMYLTQTASHLARIAHPQAANVAELVRELPATVAARKQSLAEQADDTASLRIEVADFAHSLLDRHRTLIEAVIRILEQTIHGSVARSVKARAEHLAVVAKGMELKLNIIARTQPTDPELQAALEAYSTHLDATERALREREREAEGQLRRYESAGKAMRQLATRKAEIERDIEVVRGEVARLDGRG